MRPPSLYIPCSVRREEIKPVGVIKIDTTPATRHKEVMGYGYT
jgi:hypothetical protein